MLRSCTLAFFLLVGYVRFAASPGRPITPGQKYSQNATLQARPYETFSTARVLEQNTTGLEWFQKRLKTYMKTKHVMQMCARTYEEGSILSQSLGFMTVDCKDKYVVGRITKVGLRSLPSTLPAPETCDCKHECAIEHMSTARLRCVQCVHIFC